MLKRIAGSVVVLLVFNGGALAADAGERLESVPDANPACMERNGPDCVLKSQVVPARTAVPGNGGPANIIVPSTTPSSGIVGPNSTGAPAAGVTPGSPAANSPSATQGSGTLAPRK